LGRLTAKDHIGDSGYQPGLWGLTLYIDAHLLQAAMHEGTYGR